MTRLETVFDNWNKKKRWLIHAFFWVFVLVLYSLFFAHRSNNYWQTFFFVGLLMPVTISTTYFLNYFLIPKYLLKERYGFFLLYFLYTVIAALFVEMWEMVLTFIVVARLNIKDMSPASINIPFLLAALLMIVFLGVALKMLSHWRKSKEEHQQLLLEKAEAELKFLKMQLNPHFLFNTLNNLYYLSTEKSDRAPKAILALGEMLDYVLNESKSRLVPLAKEIKQMENYIALETLRYEDRVTTTFNVTGSTEKHLIGPMTLVTLGENAFKHGVMPSSGKSWIKIDVVGNENEVQLIVRNSWQKREQRNGIGLQNLRSQLNLLFPSKHTMHVNNDSIDEFVVTLIIKTP